MEQFEYFTTYIEANMAKVPGSAAIPAGDHAKHSPYSLIPELNAFGAEGWELINIQPLIAGRNDDFVFPTADGIKWGSHYFCAFKRRLA